MAIMALRIVPQMKSGLSLACADKQRLFLRKKQSLSQQRLYLWFSNKFIYNMEYINGCSIALSSIRRN